MAHQIRPARATALNGYSSSKRNVYVLSYYPQEDALIDEELADRFNLFHLYFDIHNSCKVPGGTGIIMHQLGEIIKKHTKSIVIGHSCNGYIAHQLAAVLPQISHCVLVDAFNEFKHEDYVRKNAFKSLMANLYRQIVLNKDPGYVTSIASRLMSSLREPKMPCDSQVGEGADAFYRTVRNYPAINDCIFFQATRSSMSNPDHGPNWRPFVRGEFYLIPVKADHVAIKGHRKEIARHIIRIVLEKTE